MIKHVFSDMDHTLLNEDGKLTANTIATIRKLGLPFTCVSARAPQEMFGVIDALHLSGPQIAFNGGLIFQRAQNDRITYLDRQPIRPADAKQIIELVRQRFPETSLSWYNQDTWYTFKIDAGVEFEHQLNGTSPRVVATPNYQEDIYKVMIIEFDHTKKTAIANAIEGLEQRSVIAKSTGAAYYEVTTKSATKDAGVRFIQAREGLGKNEMIAFGDGENDVPLLKSVGISVAMGNAPPEVKKAAKFITASNQADGVAAALRKFLK